MIHRISQSLFAACLLAGLVVAQDLAPATPTTSGLAELEAQVTSQLERLRESRGFPGATAAFVLADGRSAAVAVGLADQEADLAMRPTDRMMSGSVGKMFFAVAILAAVDAGDLDLDTPVSKWLGDLAWFDRVPNHAALTLRILMRHRSGIPEHVEVADFIAACRADPDRVWQPAELVAYVLDREPLFAADTDFAYADTNYILAGMVFEKATGRTMYAAARSAVIDRLELRDTLPSDRRVIPGLAVGYGAENSPFGLPGRLIDAEGRFAINPQMEWTGGGFVWTTRDLARFGAALFGGKLVGEARLKEMLDVRPAGRLGAYGLAVIERTSPLGKVVGHSGFFPGYLCQLAHYPDLGITVAFQVNTDDVAKVGSLRRIVDEIAATLRDAMPPAVDAASATGRDRHPR